MGTLSKMFCIFWYKFGEPSLNGWRVIAWTSKSSHTDRQTDTHTQTQAMTIPVGQKRPRVKKPTKQKNPKNHRKWSTLALAMTCCTIAPSHYLNQCWLIINNVKWHPRYNVIDEISTCHVAAIFHYVICVSGNGLTSVRCQAIAWIKTDLLSIGPALQNKRQSNFNVNTKII